MGRVVGFYGGPYPKRGGLCERWFLLMFPFYLGYNAYFEKFIKR